MERRLRPFIPDLNLSFKLLALDELDLEEDFHIHLGFKEQSKQWNFLKSPHPSRFALLLMREGDDTSSPTSDETLAFVFGECQGRRMDLWHVNVNRNHPLNDSQRGERWGVYGIERDMQGSFHRWKKMDGKRVTASNHERVIRGTPNPYAVIAIFQAVASFPNVTEVQQNPEMPCAQMFHKDYHHTSHPAISLIYKSLGFRYQVGRYVWYSFFGSMQERRDKLIYFMSRGEDGVSD